MTKAPTPQEAVLRAERAQQDRIESIRRLAEARQHLDDIRADADRRRAELEQEISDAIASAESDDTRAFMAATTAGWSPIELRKIGFTEPTKTRARNRRRKAPARPADETPAPATKPVSGQ